MENIPFHLPTTIDGITLNKEQTNKIVSFKSVQGVFLDESKVDVFLHRELVKSYVIGDGLILSGLNSIGEEKTLNLTLNGADFDFEENKSFDCRCTFFTEGDVEIDFKLELKW